MPRIGSTNQPDPAPAATSPHAYPTDIILTERELQNLIMEGGSEKEIQALTDALNAQKQWFDVAQQGKSDQVPAAKKAFVDAWENYQKVKNDRHSNVPSPQMSAQEMAQAEVTAKARKTEDGFQVSAQQADINSKLES